MVAVAKAGGAAPEAAAPAAPIAPLPITQHDGLTRHVRALQLVQDRMATGGQIAIDAQRAILVQLERELAAHTPDASLPQTRQMLALALLNGANPQAIRAALAGQGADDPLLAGALAYAEGRMPQAKAQFATVDPLALPVTVRAQFSLIRGSMLVEEDAAAAQALLGRARLLAPGTLIEEAALRRQAMLAIQEPETLVLLASTYLRRFGQSPFASAFISQLAFAIPGTPPEAQQALSTQLDPLMLAARTTDRQTFYTILARTSLVGGNHALARLATERAVAEAPDPSTLLSARLYRAALGIAGKDYRPAVQELKSLMRAPLQPADQDILKAAISVAQELRRWPQDAAVPVAGDSNARTPTAPLEADSNPSGIMEAARQMLDATEPLVARP
jgi:chemotaxis protein MotC